MEKKTNYNLKFLTEIGRFAASPGKKIFPVSKTLHRTNPPIPPLSPLIGKERPLYSFPTKEETRVECTLCTAVRNQPQIASSPLYFFVCH